MMARLRRRQVALPLARRPSAQPLPNQVHNVLPCACRFELCCRWLVLQHGRPTMCLLPHAWTRPQMQAAKRVCCWRHDWPRRFWDQHTPCSRSGGVGWQQPCAFPCAILARLDPWDADLSCPCPCSLRMRCSLCHSHNRRQLPARSSCHQAANPRASHPGHLQAAAGQDPWLWWGRGCCTCMHSCST